MSVWAKIKNNKLVVVLFLVIGFLLIRSGAFSGSRVGTGYRAPASSGVEDFGPPSFSMAKLSLPISGGAPRPEIENRMVVQESNLSLVVDDVRGKVDQILADVNGKGGYMVSSSLSQPGEVPSATVVVRVPVKELGPTLEFLRELAIKVTSENLVGRDVTDEYVDLESRLETLNKTKVKFEEILSEAVSVDEILKVQREIINLQEQIDNIKGRQLYLEKTAENAKLTVYLSTDEWALPYTPEEPGFRPKVIFKLAVRSLVDTLRGIGGIAIWLGVYSVVWVPALLAFLWWRWRKSDKKQRLREKGE